MTSIDEIAVRLHDDLDAVAEAPAGICHGVPRREGHDLRVLCYQRSDCVVGG